MSFCGGQRGAVALSSQQVREYVSSTSSPSGDLTFDKCGLALGFEGEEVGWVAVVKDTQKSVRVS